MEFTRITSVVTPATAAFTGQGIYDLVDIATVKTEIAVTDNSSDSNFRRWIAWASGEAAKYCNRIFPVQTYSDQLYPPRDYFPPISIGGASPLQLRRYPIASTPCVAGIAAPAAPVLSAVAGGALAAA